MKVKTFEAYTYKTKAPKWVTIPKDKGVSYKKHLERGDPIQIVWTDETGKRSKPHMLKNLENLPTMAAA